MSKSSGHVVIGHDGKVTETPLTEDDKQDLAAIAKRMGMPDGFAGLPKLKSET